jgi:hypothetical protein
MVFVAAFSVLNAISWRTIDVQYFKQKDLSLLFLSLCSLCCMYLLPAYGSCEGGGGLFFYFKIVKIGVSIKTRALFLPLTRAR